MRMTSAQSFRSRSSQFSDRLVSAVRSAKSTDPFTPVTVLCGPGAVDDVTSALANSDKSFVNVEVQPLEIFIHNAAALLDKPRLQRSEVAAEVAAIMRPDAPEQTVFHRKGLNESAATLEGLTDAVFTLSTLPEPWRSQHQDAELPRICAELADGILATLSRRFYTFPEAVDTAAALAAERQLIVVGDIALDPLSAWALEQIAGQSVHVQPGEFAAAVEHRSFVAELDEAKYVADAVAKALADGAQLHELAVGYCSEASLPYLVRAFNEAGISHHAPAVSVWAQNSYFRALSLLLRIDPEEMNRRDLAALLTTGVLSRGEETQSPWIVDFDRVSRNSDQQFYAGEDWHPKEIASGKLEKQATAVVHWVNTLADELHTVWTASDWKRMADAFRTIARRWLRNPRGEETVYEEEFFRALERQQGPVHRARAVDAVAPLFEQAQPTATRGLVRIGALESLTGRNLHTVFIVGALDDALPGSITPSATVTETQSHLSPEEFIGARRRALDAALRCAPNAVVTHPRSHQDGSGRTEPSQWVSKEELEAHGLSLSTAADSPADGIVAMPPLSTMLLTGQITPVGAADLSLVRTAHGQADEHVSRYSEIMGYRDTGAAGESEGAEFNGYTRSEVGLQFLSKQISNSALELFTRSPQFFFIERVLDAYQLEDRVHTLDMDARERGTLYHVIFERWTKEALLGGDTTAPDDPEWWDGAGRRALETIVAETLQDHRSARVNEAVWKGFETNLWRDIDRWYATERAEYRAGWRPIAAELAFGSNSRDGSDYPAPVLHVPTGAGSTAAMAFRGLIDRVDYRVVEPTAADESQLAYTEIRITDYKTGNKHKDVASALNSSPTGSPAKKHYFQLALYGWAVHHRFVDASDPDAASWFPQIAEAVEGKPPVQAVQARYWYFQAPEDEDGQPHLDIDDKAIATLRTNLANIYQYIAAGTFPPHALPKSLWTDDAEVRIGRAQYTVVTEALAEQELTPLDITTPFDDTVDPQHPEAEARN